jgi:hypothetical protein
MVDGGETSVGCRPLRSLCAVDTAPGRDSHYQFESDSQEPARSGSVQTSILPMSHRAARGPRATRIAAQLLCHGPDSFRNESSFFLQNSCSFLLTGLTAPRSRGVTSRIYQCAIESVERCLSWLAYWPSAALPWSASR